MQGLRFSTIFAITKMVVTQRPFVGEAFITMTAGGVIGTIASLTCCNYQG